MALKQRHSTACTAGGIRPRNGYGIWMGRCSVLCAMYYFVGGLLLLCRSLALLSEMYFGSEGLL
jgi:hypothetical protein